MSKRFLMHPKALDICVLELQTENGYKFYEWWNLGYTGEPWFVQDAIEPKNIHEFVDITEYTKMKRRKPGVPC